VCVLPLFVSFGAFGTLSILIQLMLELTALALPQFSLNPQIGHDKGGGRYNYSRHRPDNLEEFVFHFLTASPSVTPGCVESITQARPINKVDKKIAKEVFTTSGALYFSTGLASKQSNIKAYQTAETKPRPNDTPKMPIRVCRIFFVAII
jgi:hypothetical protein